MLPLIPPGFAGRASWQLHGCNWSVRSAWDGSRLAGVWLWLTVGDCLADSGGALRFGAPGVGRPPRSILANYINGLGTVEKIRTRPRTVEGTKARRRGPTSCQTIPSYPHHNKVSYHISQHHRHQASSTKLHT